MSDIDDAVLDEILDGLSSDEQRMFLDTFAGDIEKQMRRSLAASSARDLQELERATHALKGVAATIGAVRLANLAARLNNALTAGDGNLSAAGIEELQDCAGKLLHELAQMADGISLPAAKNSGGRR